MIVHNLYNLAQIMRWQWAEKEKLEEIQEKNLRRIVKFAYENVPFYKKLLKKRNIRPSDIRNLEDLKKLPVIDKETILKNYHLFIRDNPYIAKNSFYVSTTRGTTGRPLPLIQDVAYRNYRFLFYLRTLFAEGYFPWERIVLLGSTEGKVQRLSGKLWRYSVPCITSEAQTLMAIKNLKPDVIRGTPTEILKICRGWENLRKIHHRPKFISVTGEALTKNSRKRIEDAFETDVYDTYTCQEAGVIGWECKNKNMHLNIDNVIIEFLDGDEDVDTGENGSVTITILRNYAMPLIRYRNGDMAKPYDDVCECGRHLPLLKSVEREKY